MANRIQLRRDTTANWNNIDPVLADGEPGYDIVTNELRIGNGSNVWSELSANTISGGGGTGNTLVNGSYTVGLGADGNLTFPTGNLVIIPGDPAGNVASIRSTDHPLGILSTGANGAVASLWIEDYANVNTSNIAAVYANPTPGSKIVRIAVGQNGGAGPKLWDFGTDGTLTFPNGTTIGSAGFTAPLSTDFLINTFIDNTGDPGTKTWRFGTDGNLTLPAGGTITEANVGLADALILTPANITYPGQQLRIYSTVPPMAEGNHLHLTTGNLYATELYLGDDNYFVKLGDTGNVGIRATTQSLSSTALWTFDPTGNLTLPAGGVVLNSDSTVYGAISTSSSVTTYTHSDVSGDYDYSSLAYSYAVNGNSSGFTIVYSAPLIFGNVDISVANVNVTGNLTLSATSQIQSPSGTGNVTIEANDGNNTRSWTFTGNGVIQNPVLTIATLPSASPAGQRAFVSDGADTAVTWSVAVSATGSNTYPVWSDGIVWRYG